MDPFLYDSFVQDPLEVIKETLFENAMNSNWVEVIKIYGENPEAQEAKITRSGDTALHIAIADGQETTVEKLLKIVKKDSLRIQNELGNTPLHLAAYLGNVKMCYCIAAKDPTLMGIRNLDKETPFFLAVRHGRKDAFLCLNSLCKGDKSYGSYRGKEGNTILHSAIDGEYFEIAIHIIHHYKELPKKINEKGFSPLRILATKPSSFRSGSHIRGFHHLIYHCIFVDEIKIDDTGPLAEGLEYDHENPKYPENYQTCVGIFILLRNIGRVLVGRSGQHDKKGAKSIQRDSSRNKIKFEADVEGGQSGDDKRVRGSSEKKNEQKKGQQSGNNQQGTESTKHKAQEHEFVPDNCATCFHFVKFITKAMLVFLGLGSTQVEKIREKKKKHIWSVQIMKKLLEHDSDYKYEYNGKSPNPSAPIPAQTTPDHDDALSEFDPNTHTDHGTNGNGKNGTSEMEKKEIALLIAAKNGIQEIVEILRGKKGTEEMEKKETALLIAAKNVIQEIVEILRGKKGTAEMEKKETALLIAAKNGIQEIVKVLRGKKGTEEMEKKETTLLIAAKNGVQEIVEEILRLYPVAVNDVNVEGKNIVLLAVENRQPHIYKFLEGRKIMKETIFRETDRDGNSALHLAAMVGPHRPWLIPGVALQMQWEIKWYEYVKESMPSNYFVRHNTKGQTPSEIFTLHHKTLVEEAGQWLKDTSQSCSVVAALIATVAFATSATVPGGVKEGKGTPTLQNEPAFGVFAISSLVALCFSVTSVVMFLAILTSRFQEKDLGKGLPRMLLVGLSSLFVSIGSMLISFCAGHFFVLKEKLKYAAFPMYAVACLPVTFFAVAQFGLYFDLVKAIIKPLPQRRSH